MKFQSTYLEADGTLVKSVLQADHEEALIHSLEQGGKLLVSARALGTGRRGEKALPSETLIAFTKAMRSLLDAGVPVLTAIQAVRDEATQPKVREVYAGVIEKVEGGSTLADALGAYPKSFDRLYVELVRSSEMTGAIHQSFEYLARFLDWQKSLRGLIRQATIYPLVLLGATYALVLAMLGFTVPRLADMINNISDEELPTSTKVLMGLSDIVANNMGLVLLGSLAAAVAFFFFVKSRIGLRVMMIVLVRMPIASGIVLTLNRARMCRTMSMLMSSGVTPIQALNMAASIVALPRLSEGLRASAQRLMDGEKLTDTFRRYKLLPGLALVMIKTGEESGDLGLGFEQVGASYDEEAQSAVKRGLAILEPVMTCVLAGIVVGVAAVVLNTLYGAMQGLQG